MRRMRVWCVRAFSAVSPVFSLMMIRGMIGAEAFVAPERHHHQARHVDSGEQGGDRADEPQGFVEARRDE